MTKVRFGKGLIWRLAEGDEPIYQRKLSVAEVQARIATCWVPYHDAVAQAIDTAHARHGYSIHLNCYAMPATAPGQGSELPGEAHADCVVGTRDGSTASEPLAQLVCAHLSSLGYSVAYHPNKGVELVRRYGEPAELRHSIQ